MGSAATGWRPFSWKSRTRCCAHESPFSSSAIEPITPSTVLIRTCLRSPAIDASGSMVQHSEADRGDKFDDSGARAGGGRPHARFRALNPPRSSIRDGPARRTSFAATANIGAHYASPSVSRSSWCETSMRDGRAAQLSQDLNAASTRRRGVGDRSCEEPAHPFPLGVGHVTEPYEAPFDVLGEAVARIVKLDAGVVQKREHRYVLEDSVNALTITHGRKVRAPRPPVIRRCLGPRFTLIRVRSKGAHPWPNGHDGIRFLRPRKVRRARGAWCTRSTASTAPLSCGA